MKTIEKKVWPEYFEAILAGRKTFELRLADFEVNEGDTLILKEWNPEINDYTGRKLEKKAGFIFKTKKQRFWSEKEIKKHGFQIISLI